MEYEAKVGKILIERHSNIGNLISLHTLEESGSGMLVLVSGSPEWRSSIIMILGLRANFIVVKKLLLCQRQKTCLELLYFCLTLVKITITFA